MGEECMFKKASLKTQVISTFILIIFLSVIGTIITLLSYIFIMYMGEKPIVRAENYYEQKVPQIQQFINNKGENLLDKKNKLELEKIIPREGIQYQILDIEGNILYGTLEEKPVKGKKELLNSINKIEHYNTKRIFGATVKKNIPISDDKGNLKGVAVIKYSIKTNVIDDKNKTLVAFMEIFLLFSPFIFIIFFTAIFTRKLIKNIQIPINEIIEASNRIKKKDLDFNINYKSNNELGKLTSSFEDMKSALRESLYNQWKMEEERKEIIKAIAHDLKTPITIIQGHVEVLLEGSINNPQRVEKYLKTIQCNTERMGRLIGDMNIASEIETQGFSLNPVSIDIVEFLENKYEDYVILAKQKNIQFILNVEDKRESRDEVLVDAQRLEQILDNIISNALRYTKDGKNVYMHTKINNTIMEFTIEDEGIGFLEKDLPYVFQKFYRGDVSRSKEKGHSGLGMYIVKSLVQKHNGWISVENREEEGARIKFVIKECK